MRSFIFGFGLYVLGVLLAATSFAARVGDQALYVGTLRSAQSSVPVSLSLKLLSQDSSGKFLVETSMTVQGQTQSSITARTAEELGDEQQAANVVQNCPSLGGVSEMLTIGSGERLRTCKFTSVEGGDVTVVHIAAVPFLNARLQQTTEGMTTTLLLQSYTRGQ